MVDILGELRHFAKGGAGDVSAACSDAITEIEFLRVYRTDVMAQVRNMTPLLERLDHENERLRAALEEVLKMSADVPSEDGGELLEALCKRALGNEQQEPRNG